MRRAARSARLVPHIVETVGHCGHCGHLARTPSDLRAVVVRIAVDRFLTGDHHKVEGWTGGHGGHGGQCLRDDQVVSSEL